MNMTYNQFVSYSIQNRYFEYMQTIPASSGEAGMAKARDEFMAALCYTTFEKQISYCVRHAFDKNAVVYPLAAQTGLPVEPRQVFVDRVTHEIER